MKILNKPLQILLEATSFGRDYLARQQLRQLMALSWQAQGEQQAPLSSLMVGINFHTMLERIDAEEIVRAYLRLSEGYESSKFSLQYWGRNYELSKTTYENETPDDFAFCYTADLELSERGHRLRGWPLGYDKIRTRFLS